MTREKNFSVNGSVVTLCGSGECCPTLDFSEKGKVIVRDDFGGKVELTKDQYEALASYNCSAMERMRFFA